jgi:hypothetical protein
MLPIYWDYQFLLRKLMRLMLELLRASRSKSLAQRMDKLLVLMGVGCARARRDERNKRVWYLRRCRLGFGMRAELVKRSSLVWSVFHVWTVWLGASFVRCPASALLKRWKRNRPSAFVVGRGGNEVLRINAFPFLVKTIMVSRMIGFAQ